jgi:hypothetical protein
MTTPTPSGPRPTEAWLVALAGSAALFATFWDDAWHTDLGRDSAWIAPHFLLYGAMAVIGVAVSAWGLREVLAARSVVAALGNRALVVAATGGLATLAAAPVDAWWHASFGRDAVLWSPPHMLVVFASAALVTGVLAAVVRLPGPVVVMVPLAGLLLGDLSVVVMEYDTDVPQFRVVFYLPVLLAAGFLSCWIIRRIVPGRWPVTGMVVVYAVTRISITVVLTAAGRDTTPVLPLAVLGFVLADLAWPRAALRYLAAGAGVSALAWAASAAGLAAEPPNAVAVVAIPIIALFVLAVAATMRPARRVFAGAAAVVLASAPVLGSARPALAHDAGEGPAVRPIHLTAMSAGDRTVRVIATVPGMGCDDLTPRDVTARRAGVSVMAPLARQAGCRFTGRVRVPSGQLWFVYVDLRDARGPLQAWLAVPADHRTRIDDGRQLYRPLRSGPPGGAEIGAGVALYALGVGLLALTCWLAAWTAGGQPIAQVVP